MAGVLIGGDDVGIVEPLHVDVLMGLDVGERAQPVAIDRGGLEVEALGGVAHLFAQLTC